MPTLAVCTCKAAPTRAVVRVWAPGGWLGLPLPLAESEQGPFPWGRCFPGKADLTGRSLGEGKFCLVHHDVTAMQHRRCSGRVLSPHTAVRTVKPGESPLDLKAIMLACRSLWEAEVN